MKTATKIFGKKVSRRRFLRTTGGLTFAVTASTLIPVLPFGKLREDEILDSKRRNSITAWVHIHTDGRVSIYNPAAEMGQGSMTALPVIIAEEMDADWAKVYIENSPIEPDVYGRSGWGRGRTMITVGSYAVRGYYDSLRVAGAQARYVLMLNAAEKWGVPLEELTTEPGFVIHPPTNRRLDFGEIASFAKAPDELPDFPTSKLKNPKDFRLIGSVMPRCDIPAKVDGSARYAIDVSLPNMVYGVISRSPVFGSKPRLLNEAEILQMRNVETVVKLDHGVGVIATKIESAIKARDALKIEWSKGVTASGYDSQHASDNYPLVAEDPTFNVREIHRAGNVGSAKAVRKTYTSDYYNDFTYHAQMEPLNAVVSFAPDKKSAEIWVGTQAPGNTKRDAAIALGLNEAKVTLHPCYLGGGFGRRSLTDYVVEACHLAKHADNPIKLIWTREDDVKYGAFRPMSLQRMKAGIDHNGDIVAWEHRIVGTGSRLLASGAEIPFYTVPNQNIEVRAIEHGVRTKHWRAVGHGPNKYAIEAFIDEIATDQGIDPLVFRQRLMRNSPRALKVINTVAKKAGWRGQIPEGRAQGLSFAERSGSLAGCVCEISLDNKQGKIRVHRVWISLDAGVVIQPDNATAQVEGSVMMGISSTLLERITFKDGEVEQSNFHDYQLLRIADAPESIDVEIIPSYEAPTGVGEVGLPNIGGALANAFASLTGKRLYHMPFTPERVKQVLKS